MTNSEIYIKDSLSSLPPLLSSFDRVIAVIDRNVDSIFGASLQFNEKIVIDADEQHKNIETVMYVVEELIRMEADRNILLLGIGGGITTDVTGFAASCFKRGVRFAFVPTTLLAQVDASIGGKNGVNVNGLKNMIGTITPPEFVYSSTSFLNKLPKRELTNGLAELLKTFILGDAEAYEDAVALFSSDTEKVMNEHCEDLAKLITKAAQIKSEVVKQDMKEEGERRKLNFGHTFAHAIECCSAENGADVRHGEAVAIGIIMAAKLSVNFGYTPISTVRRLCEDFKAVGLPTETKYTYDQLLAAVRNDKKRDRDFLHFVFLNKIGDVNIVLTPFDKLKI